MSPLALEQAASEKKENMVSYPFNSTGSRKTKIDPDEVSYLNRVGFSDNRIAEILHASQGGISRVRYRLGLKANYPNYSGDNIPPEQAQRALVKNMKAYYEANKDKAKAYYEANKDKITANMKAYREANKDKITANMKAYYEANKDKAKAYYEANKDKKEEAFLKARGWSRPVLNGKKKLGGGGTHR